jgi:hypothetical protein
MKNLGISRLPDGIASKISRQFADPPGFRRDKSDLIEIAELLIT